MIISIKPVHAEYVSDRFFYFGIDNSDAGLETCLGGCTVLADYSLQCSEICVFNSFNFGLYDYNYFGLFE